MPFLHSIALSWHILFQRLKGRNSDSAMYDSIIQTNVQYMTPLSKQTWWESFTCKTIASNRKLPFYLTLFESEDDGSIHTPVPHCPWKRPDPFLSFLPLVDHSRPFSTSRRQLKRFARTSSSMSSMSLTSRRHWRTSTCTATALPRSCSTTRTCHTHISSCKIWTS